eukprot:1328174-Rhodomonas_salina.1
MERKQAVHKTERLDSRKTLRATMNSWLASRKPKTQTHSSSNASRQFMERKPAVHGMDLEKDAAGDDGLVVGVGGDRRGPCAQYTPSHAQFMECARRRVSVHGTRPPQSLSAWNAPEAESRFMECARGRVSVHGTRRGVSVHGTRRGVS